MMSPAASALSRAARPERNDGIGIGIGGGGCSDSFASGGYASPSVTAAGGSMG